MIRRIDMPGLVHLKPGSIVIFEMEAGFVVIIVP